MGGVGSAVVEDMPRVNNTDKSAGRWGVSYQHHGVVLAAHTSDAECFLTVSRSHGDNNIIGVGELHSPQWEQCIYVRHCHRRRGT